MLLYSFYFSIKQGVIVLSSKVVFHGSGVFCECLSNYSNNSATGFTSVTECFTSIYTALTEGATALLKYYGVEQSAHRFPIDYSKDVKIDLDIRVGHGYVSLYEIEISNNKEEKTLLLKAFKDQIEVYTEEYGSEEASFVVLVDILTTEGLLISDEYTIISMVSTGAIGDKARSVIMLREFDNLFKSGKYSLEEVVSLFKKRGFSDKQIYQAILNSLGSAVWED